MIYEQPQKAVDRPEHIRFAEEVAERMLDAFGPMEQNEIIGIVKTLILKSRDAKIENLKNELDFIFNATKSLQNV